MSVGTVRWMMDQRTFGESDVAVRTSAGGPAWSMTWGGLKVHVWTLTRNVAEPISEATEDVTQADGDATQERTTDL